MRTRAKPSRPLGSFANTGAPPTDGIVGVDVEGTLRNLGRLARPGMAEVDRPGLLIMQDKHKTAGGHNFNRYI